jgi:imidazolonepropionase-like amidohydrolase
MRYIQSLALLLVTGLLVSCSPQNQSVDLVRTAIVNTTVIDVVNGVRQNQTIVFEGDEIVAVGPTDTIQEVSKTIDGSGKFVIPGLWDMHVHLTASNLFDSSILPLLLSYGITSVRDTGGMLEDLLPLIEESKKGKYPGQRIYYSGPLLDGEFVVYDGSSLFRPSTGTANTMPEKAAATVAELKKNGASFIKIYEMVQPEVFDALVTAAEKENLPVAAHVPLSTRASLAGPRLASMEHLRNILLDCTSNTEELLGLRQEMLTNKEGMLGGELRSSIHREQRKLAMQHQDRDQCQETINALVGTIQVPTLSLGNRGEGFSLRQDWLDAVSRLPEPVRSIWQAAGSIQRGSSDSYRAAHSAAQKELVKRMLETGVVFGAGTDIPIPPSVPGHSLHLELEALVAAGLSPLEAIGAATLTPAKFFSIEHEIGSVDVGKKADLLILSLDPLENISNTQSIESIIAQGRHLDEADITKLTAQSSEGTLMLDILSVLYKLITALGFSLF